MTIPYDNTETGPGACLDVRNLLGCRKPALKLIEEILDHDNLSLPLLFRFDQQELIVIGVKSKRL